MNKFPPPRKFRKNNYTYILLERGQPNATCPKGATHVALYAQNKEESTTTHYEVIITRERPEVETFGKLMPAGVRMPSNEDFGTWGWSHTLGKNEANNKFQSLTRGGTDEQ